MNLEFEIGWQNGIVIRNNRNRLIFDPVSKSSIHKEDLVFITHSHADHMSGFAAAEAKYSTEESKNIFEKIREKTVTNFSPVKTNQTLNFDDLQVTPLNAGHMLGSVQYKIETPNSNILYTGDINYVDTLITEKANTVECDTLIIEATFGNPAFIFPKRENIYVEIIKWSLELLKNNKIPVFHVYAAGKAQEIIKVFNEFTNLQILTHPRISKICKVYSKGGIELEHSELDYESEIVKERSCVYVTLPSKKNLNFDNGVKAVTTGWIINNAYRYITGFPLSGHADFKQLISFIERTGAKKVFIYTGFKKAFSSYLSKKLGINAKPIPVLPSRTLKEFLS